MDLTPVLTKQPIDASTLNSLQIDKIYELVKELGRDAFIIHVDARYLKRNMNVTRQFMLDASPAPRYALNAKSLEGMVASQRLMARLDAGERVERASAKSLRAKLTPKTKRKPRTTKPAAPVVEEVKLESKSE